MKKSLLTTSLAVLLCLPFATACLAGEKEELTAKLETISVKMDLLRRDTVVLEFVRLAQDAQVMQTKLQQMEKAEKEQAEKEKKEKK